MVRRIGWLTTIAVTLAVAAVPSGGAAAQANCSAPLPQGDEAVTLDPADFVTAIDNPSWPMAPGSRWVYRETSSGGPGQKVVVTVKSRTKEVLGIAATVVHDEVTEDGALVEDTFDWYAQDVCGNVWYLGENTREFEDGHVVSTAGSWEAGVDDAQPGVIAPSDPEIGFTYRQEFRADEAEDVATTLSLAEQVTVPFGHVDTVRMTRETTPLEPRLLEYKWYAPGVGPVLSIAVSGGSDREELISFRSGA